MPKRRPQVPGCVAKRVLSKATQSAIVSAQVQVARASGDEDQARRLELRSFVMSMYLPKRIQWARREMNRRAGGRVKVDSQGRERVYFPGKLRWREYVEKVGVTGFRGWCRRFICEDFFEVQGKGSWCNTIDYSVEEVAPDETWAERRWGKRPEGVVRDKVGKVKVRRGMEKKRDPRDPRRGL